jgi:hypothetical protein|nr:MAG TPA: hypothetical protein [Caudoviricetes sp.]
MYTVHEAFGKAINGNGTWEKLDLDNVQCGSLFNTYTHIVVNFKDSFRKDRLFSLNLNDHFRLFSGFKGTFREWLDSLGNKSLPLQDGKYIIQKGKVQWEDAVRAGFKMYPIGDTASIDADIPLRSRSNILLKKRELLEETNTNKRLAFYKGMGDKCLISVGGFFHMTDYDDKGLYIVDGMKTVLAHRAYTPMIGITSFDKVGKLKYIQITEKMIYAGKESRLYERAFIKLPESIEGKSLMVSIGGYLHILDWMTVRANGINVISIDFKNMPLFDRIYESMQYLDFDRHLQPTHGSDKQHLDPEEIMSDVFLKRYLTMSQSFIVLVDTPDLYIQRHHVRSTKLPYQYIYHEFPNYPLFNGHGKVSEYWSIYDEGLWEVNAFENYKHNRTFHTHKYEEEYAVTSNRLTWQRTEHSLAYLLEIGKESVKYIENKK